MMTYVARRDAIARLTYVDRVYAKVRVDIEHARNSGARWKKRDGKRRGLRNEERNKSFGEKKTVRLHSTRDYTIPAST